MRVVFATAELRPLVSAGGLGEAAAGLAAALNDQGVDVITVIPGYSSFPLDDEEYIDLDVPEWASPASARIGRHPDAGRLAVIDVPGIARPDPYVDESGAGWADNDARFAAFSAAVAALSRAVGADLVHLNDWHTSLTPAFLGDDIPVVLTIHNLAHQGWAAPGWLYRLPRYRDLYAWGDAVNGLAGAIRLAAVTGWSGQMALANCSMVEKRSLASLASERRMAVAKKGGTSCRNVSTGSGSSKMCL